MTYYYVLNLQGDVVKLLYADGSIRAEYTYNAWGEILSATNPSSSSVNIQDINPLRYRGYYYDTETGFYYLQSRYYDPIVKRFINADDYAATGQGMVGNNMFAYCNNNPTCLSDDCGDLPTHAAMVTDGGPRDPRLEELMANAKYNKETVKVILVGEEEKYNIDKDDIYITFSIEKEDPSKSNIRIHNSYKINDVYEMYAIVDVMMGSVYYKQGEWSMSAADYVSQWCGHNSLYHYLPFSSSHTADVDFKADEKHNPWWDYIG